MLLKKLQYCEGFKSVLRKISFFIRANRKLKFHYKNRKNPDKNQSFFCGYIFFCSPLMAEAKGFVRSNAVATE